MINLAGNPECDGVILRELAEAGIDAVYHARRTRNEVPASITGEVCDSRYIFIRGWTYWIVKGKVPIEIARAMYAVEGRRDVRVAGHCMSPPPDEWAEPSEAELRFRCEFEKFSYELLKDCRYVTSYHIDTQEGLNFFVEYVTEKKREAVA